MPLLEYSRILSAQQTGLYVQAIQRVNASRNRTINGHNIADSFAVVGQRYVKLFITDTSSLTALMLFWKSAFSLSLRSSSIILSTPQAPKTTGTPT